MTNWVQNKQKRNIDLRNFGMWNDNFIASGWKKHNTQTSKKLFIICQERYCSKALGNWKY